MSVSRPNHGQGKLQIRPPTGPPVPKLRSSCDSCHVAKVKCSPTGLGPQQNCARCLSHGIPCSYSPSLRIGKPHSAKHSNAPSSSTPTRSRRPSAAANVGAEVESSSRSTASERIRRFSRASSGEASQALSDDYVLGGGDLPRLGTNHGWEDTPRSYMGGPDLDGPAASSDAYDHQQMACFLPTPSISSSGLTTTSTPSSYDYSRSLWTDKNYLQSCGLTTEPSTNHHDGSVFWNGEAVNYLSSSQGLANPSPLQGQNSASCVRGQVTLGDGKASLFGQSTDTVLAKAQAQAQAQGDARLGDVAGVIQSGNSASAHACNCLSRLLQALQIPPQMTQAVRAKDSAPVVAFDVLLIKNKQAIDRCVAMLGCPSCFGSSTSFLLISALLNQTLALYHSACEHHLARPATSVGSADVAPSIVPGPLRLNFGAYRIEEKDEILLKKELMLIELRKVESLLSRLKDLIGQVEDRSESSTYETLVAHLARHLQQTVTVILPRR